MVRSLGVRILRVNTVSVDVPGHTDTSHHCHLVKISDDPVTVQLNFEPTKRMAPSEYRLQERQNICSVCGATEDFMRRLIVPLEYRK